MFIDLRTGNKNLAVLHRPREARLLFKDSPLGVPHSAPVQDPEGDWRFCRRPQTSDLCRKFERKRVQDQERGSEGGVEQLAADHRRAGVVNVRKLFHSSRNKIVRFSLAKRITLVSTRVGPCLA